MSHSYLFTDATNTSAIRSSDGALVPWSVTPSAGPLDIGGLAGRTWLQDGSPTPSAYVAPPPSPPTLTFLQFMALFTSEEQDAIVNSTDTQTKLFLMMATGAGTITLDNSEVIDGLGYLASQVLITPARAVQILANEGPSPTS